MCDSSLNLGFKKPKNNDNTNVQQNNKGRNYFSAPMSSSINDERTLNTNNISQMTMTMDKSYNIDLKKPTMYQYSNAYKVNNSFQKSIIKASLREIGGQNNSLMLSNFQNQTIPANSIYSSKYDDTKNESSFEVMEYIIDGKMDENMVKQSKDQNIINNYNEFITKKENNNNLNNKKIMDYYYKYNNNKNEDIILKEEKEIDEMSGISNKKINSQF